MDCGGKTPMNWCGHETRGPFHLSMISVNGCRFRKKNCGVWPILARSIVSPLIVATPCGEWKKPSMMICSSARFRVAHAYRVLAKAPRFRRLSEDCFGETPKLPRETPALT